jgi:hypothetical protein
MDPDIDAAMRELGRRVYTAPASALERIVETSIDLINEQLRRDANEHGALTVINGQSQQAAGSPPRRRPHARTA